jgi:solute carrier family 30 (zinc transporter), member 2
MSCGVIIAATIIYFEPTYTYADPACTFIFSIVVCCTTGPIIKKCVAVLMEGAPPNIDTEELITEIKAVSGCKSIHDFHIWSLSVGKYAISAHVDTEEPMKALK